LFKVLTKIQAMKKIIIGTLVGTVIYFVFQTIMWMGGFHKDFYTYAAKQDTVMKALSANLPSEGLYMMPMADPKSPDFKVQQEKLEKTMVGNPWAMVFYHPRMSAFSAFYLLKGIMHALIATLVVALVLWYSKFSGFWHRFFVSMAFAVFTLVMAVFSDMNWWSFPWSFVQTQVIDLVFGWGLCSVWLAWFVKLKNTPVQG
jgi:hypothetical protein